MQTDEAPVWKEQPEQALSGGGELPFIFPLSQAAMPRDTCKPGPDSDSVGKVPLTVLEHFHCS